MLEVQAHPARRARPVSKAQKEIREKSGKGFKANKEFKATKGFKDFREVPARKVNKVTPDKWDKSVTQAPKEIPDLKERRVTKATKVTLAVKAIPVRLEPLDLLVHKGSKAYKAYLGLRAMLARKVTLVTQVQRDQVLLPEWLSCGLAPLPQSPQHGHSATDRTEPLTCETSSSLAQNKMIRVLRKLM